MATAAARADRIPNRAPRGGAVSPVNGRFYAGGQFLPMARAAVEAGPARLEGSFRQVAWATRLRRQALVRLDEEIDARLLFLSRPKDAKAVRPAIRRLLFARYGLLAERSATSIIDRRATATA